MSVRPGHGGELLWRKKPAAASGNDPFWSSVVLLVVNDSKANGTTSFADQSNSAHVMTAQGTAQYSTAQAPTGMTSSMATGVTAGLTAANSTDFQFGGDFTLEAMIRYTNLPSVYNAIMAKSTDVNNGEWNFFYNNSVNKLRFFFNNSVDEQQAWTPSTATWYHVALVRSGNNWYHFVAGSQLGSTIVDATAITGTTDMLGIGIFNNSAHGLDGYMANVRITKGVARYTSNFTAPTLPMPTS